MEKTMQFMKFQEYLDRNNKIQKPVVRKVADFEGKVDTKPVKEKKAKDAGGVGQKDETKPYKGNYDAQDPNKGKLKDGFANTGDKKLVYEPKTNIPDKIGEGGVKQAT